MNRWIRRGAFALAGLVLLAGGVIVGGTLLAERKAQRRIALPAYPLTVKTDAPSIERGRYLFASRGCAECHGPNAGGRVFIDDAKSGLYARGPNISPGGVVAAYTPADWERSIRHGVRPAGTPLLVMPSEDYNRLTDDDLGALVGYVQQLPAVPGAGGEVRLPTIVKLLYAAGVVPDAAERIDHTLPPAQPVPEGVNLAHGAYVANMCIGCHGPHLSGGRIPGGPPDWPPAANLTPGAGSAMPRYADAGQFARMLKSGKRPDGSAIAVMPFETLSKLNEVDVAALDLYLRSVPPRPAGEH